MSLMELRRRIAPWRNQMLEHPLYAELRSPRDLQVFMEHHVFAVWDFMSLLKSLQQRMTSITVPWLPPARPAAARLVNEIVLGEETDVDGQGGYASHFDLYCRSMRQFGASTAVVESLLESLRAGIPLDVALGHAAVPPASAAFVRRTFAVIAAGDDCRIAAALTFGREELLPDVFERIVDELSRQAPGFLSDFQYYLLRHVELDGGEHGPMSARLMEDLCGDSTQRWEAATETAVDSLRARLAFWNAIRQAILVNR